MNQAELYAVARETGNVAIMNLVRNPHAVVGGRPKDDALDIADELTDRMANRLGKHGACASQEDAMVGLHDLNVARAQFVTEYNESAAA